MSDIANQSDTYVALAKNQNDQDVADEELKAMIALREKCPRFRILVIGKANAGKTTILQKMCNATDGPIIRDQEGNEVDPLIINPTSGRGIHDINHEMTFSSNPSFVFHDSRGFEANSTEEITNVHNFIAERAASNDLKSQLHAIWYCLPVDNDRPLSKAEMAFFETGTGKVPVIAIFTKFDGLDVRCMRKLRQEGKSIRDAKVLAPEAADRLFREDEHYIKKLEKANFPPAAFLCLRYMQKATTNCSELTQKTLGALDNKTLQFLFVTVQQNNIQLCTEYAIEKAFMPMLSKLSLMKAYQGEESRRYTEKQILIYYPHIWNQSYEIKHEEFNAEECLRLEEAHELQWALHHLPLALPERAECRLQELHLLHSHQEAHHAKCFAILQPVLSILAGSPLGLLPILRTHTGILILMEASHWIRQKNPTLHVTEALQAVVFSYETSGKLHAIREAVDEVFPWFRYRDIRADEREATKLKIMEIVKKFVIVT